MDTVNTTRLDPDSCYRALVARDARFDGTFFVGVTTTGVYCRPICPARTPGRARCDFFTRAAEAERAGYRACFRCRPELAPGAANVDAVPRLVRAAIAKIEAGALNEASVDDLAAELGVTARHLRRAMESEIGVAPVELAQTRRLALAKQLLRDTPLTMTEVAFASGFASLRRFNAAVRERFGCAPSELRAARKVPPPRGEAFTIRLDHREPYDWDRLLGFLAARAIPGVESVEHGAYRRSVAIGGATGWISATKAKSAPAIVVEVSFSLVAKLPALAPRLRALFDLDARPDVIAARLGENPALAPSVRARPGLRVPGAFDAFELAVRAILGQQVSVRGATTLAGRFVERFGKPLEASPGFVTSVFPGASDVVSAGAPAVRDVGMPMARAEAIVALAGAFASGEIDTGPGADGARVRQVLSGVRGIGPWTVEYFAMRALRDTDAFPAGDLVVMRGLGAKSPRAAETAAGPWSPWRSYGVLHLWSIASEGERS